MSEPIEPDDNELDPELSALLRDEPVVIDPARREAAISAALELGATILPIPTAAAATEPTTGPTTEPAAPLDGTATSDDELAARRRAAPSGRPAARPPDRRRGLLVAAAVVVVGGLGAAGILANLEPNGGFVNSASEESGSADMADSPADLETSASADDGDADGTRRLSDEGAQDDAVTTTVPPMSQGSQAETAAVADLGAFDSVDQLLGLATKTTGATSAAPGAVGFDGGGACAATIAASGGTVTGRALVGTTPVVVGTASPDGATIVVLDAVTCVELGRR